MSPVMPFPKQKPPKRFAFSMMSSVLIVLAAASALALVHDWGKGAIASIEWLCGISVVLLLISMFVDWRRP
ncbi:hypothetical protein [Dyella sp. ASV21]|uniref:hypothetical protein n=1 Tax=Dyella sp. ASV21 TaxID=2795114 RepID=UPI0018ECAEEE|nr:hypothetical protein [Dyella sp. ASV21]